MTVTSLNIPQARANQVAREDLVMFINACFACTGQREFYSSGFDQRVSIDFLHHYILGNYRLLYARTLAAGVNHFGQAQILVNLLATGRDTPPEHRAEENALIGAALRALPPHRAWNVLESLRKRGVNNRRSRAVARDYLASRSDPSFHVVKYRRQFLASAIHAHLVLPGETGVFLFEDRSKRTFQTPLLETFRQAQYSAEAIYKLPYSIAEGLAARKGLKREVFLERIAPQMTSHEKLRLQRTSERAGLDAPMLDWERLPLTRLALFILSMPWAERRQKQEQLEEALRASARHTLRAAPMRLGRVAAVLDNSYSTSGSQEKRRRPLAVAIAAHSLLQEASGTYRSFWTSPMDSPVMAAPRGQTDLATPLLDALEWKPDLVVIVSDGFENDPPRGAAEALRVFRERLDPLGKTTIVHCNPVFHSDDFTLQELSPYVPTVGLRDAEDLPTMLGFARFASGAAPLSELETYLAARAAHFLGAAPLPEEAKESEEGE
ncbi:hypothetical protein CCAX7_37470 [Capsulimonas corticalis]|uniref:Uncharacterized protein n=1 Tax=Capsulimonas corticalis TaxID=2219043 RepID=A0A402D123_9BACT|nr:hypothetical protein [Capsulimonas corticalis]BDI31696.1 hypothetical protein CCAX7_37470 [Capsulimonas corticalis]